MVVNYIIELKVSGLEDLVSKDDYATLNRLRESADSELNNWNMTTILAGNRFFVKIRDIKKISAKNMHLIKMYSFNLLIRALTEGKIRGNEYKVQGWILDWISSYIKDINRLNSLLSYWRTMIEHVESLKDQHFKNTKYERVFNSSTCSFRAGFEIEDTE